MANTFELIASYTATGSVSSIDFTSIPQTFTDLVVKASLRHSTTSDQAIGDIKINGSVSLTGKLLGSNGSVAFSQGTPAYGINSATSTASTFNNLEFYIPNYTGSNNKSFSLDSVTENNATAAVAAIFAGLWNTTSAITSISIIPYSGNTLVANSTAYLYGVKNA